MQGAPLEKPQVTTGLQDSQAQNREPARDYAFLLHLAGE